jgi:hypothetical protein
MALDEQTRHALHTRFEEVLGAEHAVAAMSAYPPAGEELATKRDLHEFKLEFEAMLHREISVAIASQTRTIVVGLIGTMLTTGGFMLAAVGLTG